MRKKLVNEKRDELKQMPREAFIDRILDYPDQNSLNRDSGNRKRDFPVGKVAEGIRDKGYEMSDKQYYALIHDFAEITVPNMKVAGSSQFKLGEDGPMVNKELVSEDGAKSTYETDFLLRPSDGGNVMVMAQSAEGDLYQVGFVNPKFAAANPITEDMEVPGQFTDYSNGNFKNVSYSFEIDVEPLKQAQAQEQQASASETAEKAQDAEASETAENPLALTADDLDFAKQMELSDLGLS